MRDDWKWRIALAEADLPMGAMAAIGMGVPTQFEYNDHTVETGQSDGGVGHYGYIRATALWLRLDPVQVYWLRKYIDDARASATRRIFMTVLRGNATSPGSKFVDISARPNLSNPTPAQPLVAADGMVYENLQLDLNNITVVNEDPTF